MRHQRVFNLAVACAGGFLLGVLAGAAPQPVPMPQGVRIIFGPNGQLVLVPAPDPQETTAELPIVNNGFFSDEDVKGPIAPLIKALESASYQDRRAASEALYRLPPGRLPEVVEAIKGAKDDEVIARLTEAAGHLFLKPRTTLKGRTSLLGVWFNRDQPSMLGIKFNVEEVRLLPTDEMKTVTVQVLEIQPGFPAAQELRDGDRIVAVGGRRFGEKLEDTDFRSGIAQLWPGSVVPMTILRDGKLVALNVQTCGVPGGDVAGMINNRTGALAGFLESVQRNVSRGGVQ